MRNNKLIFSCLLVLALVTSLSTASVLESTKCEVVLSKFGINPMLKSNSGWLRVCSNDKLHLYTENNLTRQEKDLICKCVITVEKDRSVENFGEAKP